MGGCTDPARSSHPIPASSSDLGSKLSDDVGEPGLGVGGKLGGGSRAEAAATTEWGRGTGGRRRVTKEKERVRHGERTGRGGRPGERPGPHVGDVQYCSGDERQRDWLPFSLHRNIPAAEVARTVRRRDDAGDWGLVGRAGG